MFLSLLRAAPQDASNPGEAVATLLLPKLRELAAEHAAAQANRPAVAQTASRRELSDKARALEERVRLKEDVVHGKQMEARNAEQSLEAQRASADAKEQQVSRGRDGAQEEDSDSGDDELNAIEIRTSAHRAAGGRYPIKLTHCCFELWDVCVCFVCLVVIFIIIR